VQFEITFAAMMAFITLVWIAVRVAVCLRAGRVSWKREAQLLLVYVCLVVVARFVFFPFSLVDGQVQPLPFDAARILPFWLNLEPLVHLFDYEVRSEAWINLIGNTAMFVPVGVIWPAVFKELRAPLAALAAGAGFSLLIELVQLPFYDRATDIDDLLLNTLGFAIGYALYALAARLRRR